MDEVRVIVDPEWSVEVVVPPFSTDERAIARTRAIAMRRLPLLGMRADFAGPLSGLRGTNPRSIISAPLWADLQDWANHGVDAWVMPGRWDTEEARELSLAMGERLFSRLVEELWDTHVVVPIFRGGGLDANS